MDASVEREVQRAVDHGVRAARLVPHTEGMPEDWGLGGVAHVAAEFMRREVDLDFAEAAEAEAIEAFEQLQERGLDGVPFAAARGSVLAMGSAIALRTGDVDGASDLAERAMVDFDDCLDATVSISWTEPVSPTPHPIVSDDVRIALLRFEDVLCSCERNAGRSYVLVLLPTQPDEGPHVSIGGKPADITPELALQLAGIERDTADTIPDAPALTVREPRQSMA